MSYIAYKDWFQAVMEDNATGYTGYVIEGQIHDIDTADGYVPIWSAVTGANKDAFVPLSAADTMDVSSDDANDDGSPAGTGAQTLLITGVDGTGDLQSETITMDGVTPVTTSNSYLFILSMKVAAAGSAQRNIGNIKAVDTTSGQTYAYVPADHAQTEQALFYTPNGTTAYLHHALIESSKAAGVAPTIDIIGYNYDPVTNVKTIITDRDINVDYLPVSNGQRKLPKVLPEKTFTWFEVQTDQNNTRVRARLEIVTKDN